MPVRVARKRWSMMRKTHIEPDPKIEAFLAEYADLCVKHHLSIGHEDHQGAFIIDECDGLDDGNLKWVRSAYDNVTPPLPAPLVDPLARVRDALSSDLPNTKGGD